MLPRNHLVLIVVVATLLAGCSSFVEIQPQGVEIPFQTPTSTSIVLAADGTEIAGLHAEQDRIPVALSDIPLVVQNAVIATEDARFYEHDGVDVRAITRAAVTNLAEGEVRQGGSTITQQLIKNLVTGADETLDRKLQEASFALQLEADMTKEEILERYLNTVYFGNGAYGVGAAARRYFDREINQLELEHAALLAAMLKAPTNYNPYEHPDAAKDRRNLVFQLMADNGYLSQEEADAATALPLGIQPLPPVLNWTHPYAVDHALAELQHSPQFRVLGETPSERAERLFGGGLVIETTIDPRTQRAAEEAIASVLINPGSDPSAAVVVIDPSTGFIRALVGGRDYLDPLDPIARFNLATDGRRQPGSSFKAIVLAAALEDGWSLEDMLPAPAQMAIPMGSGQQTWLVGNAGDADFGTLTLRTATAWSVNTVYAQVINAVGADSVVDVAHRLGVTSDLEALNSIALGAQEVAPIEMASVMATFAAEGIYREPQIISRITDADGVVIWEHPGDTGVQAIDVEVARGVTLALEGVVREGTGRGANLGRPTAGKTGTSQNYSDAWFTGYTPDFAAAVWVGFPEGLVPMEPPRTRITVSGATWPAEIFARTGIPALSNQVATPFTPPGGELVSIAVDLTRDCLPNPYTPPEVIGYRGYIPGTEPTSVCTEPSGPPTADVPSVVGQRVEQARQALTDAGFIVIENPVFSAEAPPGQVLSQTPPPGAGQVLTETGYEAVLEVATSDRIGTVVPDVQVLALNVARHNLEAQGYNVAVQVGCPNDTATCTQSSNQVGVVWGQDPAPGTEVPLGALITLYVYPS